MKDALFLFNPHAGTGKIASGLATIMDTLTKAGFLVTAYPTQSKGDAFERIVQWGDLYERIIVAGGDGMLHEALNAMMKLKERGTVPDLGYIPSGTTNDFAKTHKIPTTVDKAAKIAAGESRKTIDLGTFNGEYFSYVAAFGAGTDISYTTDQSAKNAFGYLAYLANGLKYIDPRTLSAVCREMEISTDDAIYTGSFILGAVSNSRSISGMKQLAPKDAKMDDGLLEGLFVRKPKNIIDLERISNGLVLGNLNSSGIISVKSRRFEFKSKKEAAWTLDGESGGSHTTVEVEDVERCITMLMP
jgi:diacylglycerol kinase (ATP)